MATSTVGRTLGRYQLLRHLASGGMADVYLARTSGLEGFERHVVVKRIRAQEARDETYVRMFLDEARLAAALHHQNIVQVHDVGQEGDEYFFAMEYIHGKDARELLKKAASRKEHVPLEHVIAIVASAAVGLHHAHGQLGPDRKPLGLVHRDVSPSNILIGYDGSIKVADFGIAKAALRPGATNSGTLKGKVAYMSPEQCNGKAVDRRSDVFALGIVLYELVTARRLFKADSEYLTMTAIVSGVIPSPSKFRPELPAELEAIIGKALATAPDERYATADDLRRALDQCATATGLQMSTTSLADYMTMLFGTRLQPWLTDVVDDPDEGTVVDEAGSGSGLAASPDLSLTGLEGRLAPDAPIVRARKKQITSVPLVGDADAPFSSPTTSSGTPMAWTPELRPAPRRRLAWIGAIALVVTLGVFGVVRWSGGDGTSAPVTEPRPASRTPPSPATEPVPPPSSPTLTPPATAATPTAPSQVEPTLPPTPAIAATPARPTALPKAKPAHPRPTHPKPTSADPEWDRTALFPK